MILKSSGNTEGNGSEENVSIDTVQTLRSTRHVLPPAAPPPTSASPRQQPAACTLLTSETRQTPSSLPSFSTHTSESSRAYLQTTPETVPSIDTPQSGQHHHPVTKKPPLTGFPPPLSPLNSQTSAPLMTILFVLYQMFLETLSQLLTPRVEVWGVTFPAARAGQLQ